MDDRELLLFDIVNLSLLARNNFSRTIRETTFNIFASLEFQEGEDPGIQRASRPFVVQFLSFRFSRVHEINRRD